MKLLMNTPRLSISHLTQDDKEFIFNLLNTPGWLQYIGDRNIHSTTDALNYLQNGPIKSYQLNGFGLYCVKIKASKEAIGICGLLKRDFLDVPDLGFAFLPQYEGMGYAFEAAQTILRYDSKIYNLDVVKAITLPNNTKSIRLLEKLGFLFDSSILDPQDVELSVYQYS